MISVDGICETLGPMALRVAGDTGRMLKVARPLNQAEPGALTYVKPSFSAEAIVALNLRDVALICSEEQAAALPAKDITTIATPNARLAFMRAVQKHFSRPRPAQGVHPRAFVDPTAIIDASASIGPHCFVGAHCVIGARTVLYPNVTIMDHVQIGEDVTINSGTVIGADGFGYERNELFELEKFPHIGGVVIEADVEIGSNTSIDRGTLGNTIIRQGTRIDNQCHISHNVEIGRHCAVIAQTMIGGSARIGDFSWLAPASIIINQAKIGERSTVGIGAVVTKSVPDGATVMGSPAVPAEEFRAQRAALKKLMS